MEKDRLQSKPIDDADFPPGPESDSDAPVGSQANEFEPDANSGDEPLNTAAPGKSSANFTKMSPTRVLGKDVFQVGDYRLVRKLGEGAMGAVYKAKQISFKRNVALKVLFPHVANNPKLVNRLYREGLVMGKLDHPNIVQAYAVGEADGCHYVAMEYVAGQSMQKWLMHLGRVSVGDAVRITLDCARALAYAHAQGMVHRDVKPDNVLVTRTGIVKVADLGMVKTHDEDMSLTQTGHAVGTPWYMPLEQARNAKEIDGRSDIYALGCTLYALLTGRPPFVGQTIVDVIQAKEVGTFPPARQSSAEVPERLDLIIAKMTAKSPKNRYQNCTEVIKDIEGLQLANDQLSFLDQQSESSLPGPPVDTHAAAKTRVPTAVAKSSADTKLAVPESFDPDIWYVQTKSPTGGVTTRKYTTAQLRKMVADDMINLTAFVSHSPTEGFRAAATYKEFQGMASSKVSKQAHDKNTARYRGLYKKIEEGERKREEREIADQENKAASASRRYWISTLFTVLPIVLGFILLVAFFYWIARIF